MQLIDKSIAIMSLCTMCANGKLNMNCCCCGDDCETVKMIRGLDAIEAEPVRHGRWEKWGFVFHGIEWKRCSLCGSCAGISFSYYGWLDGKIELVTPDYCGSCGAKMDGDENGAD